DSSSIVCVADRLLDAREVEAINLSTISWVFDRSTGSDEQPFIIAVEQKRGHVGYHLAEKEYIIFAGIPDDYLLDVPSPDHCFFQLYHRMQQVVSGTGARILLRGIGGDHVLWGQVSIPYEPLDWILQKCPLKALESFRSWGNALRTSSISLFWWGIMWPLLPRTARAFLGPVNSRLAPWLDRRFVSRMCLRDRLLEPRDTGGF